MELPKELETMLVTPNDEDYEKLMDRLIDDMLVHVLENVDVDKELQDVDLNEEEKEMIVTCFCDGFKEGYKTACFTIRESLLKENK